MIVTMGYDAQATEEAVRAELLARNVPGYALQPLQQTVSREGTVVTASLRGFIGGRINDLNNRLDELVTDDVTELQLSVTSGGGIVDYGHALYGRLRSYAERGVKITVRGEGMVASAAVAVFLAGDERSTAEGTRVMLHAPYLLILAAINRANMGGTTARLDAVLQSAEAAMLEIYTARGIADPQQYLDGEDHFLSRAQAYKAKITTVSPDGKSGATEQTADQASSVSAEDDEHKDTLARVMLASKAAFGQS